MSAAQIADMSDILSRIDAYDSSNGGHSDASGGSAYDLMEDAKQEIIFLRNGVAAILDGLRGNSLSRQHLLKRAAALLPAAHDQTDNSDDGQPDERQEWRDYDPEC